MFFDIKNAILTKNDEIRVDFVVSFISVSLYAKKNVSHIRKKGIIFAKFIKEVYSDLFRKN
jgi:hypothetical protein